MNPCARWLRREALGALDLHSTCAGLAASQSRESPPIVLWGSAGADLCLGPASRPARASGDSELAWAAGGDALYALIVPLRWVPGRAARRAAWGLGAAAATYRHLGIPVYLDEHALWLHGRRLAACSVVSIGECALIVSSLPRQSAPRCGWPDAHELEALYRARIEAQHGWLFEHSWPSRAEHEAIGESRLTLVDWPYDDDVRGRLTATDAP